MIVFDLKCSHDHVFEAWFASSDAYEEQRNRGLVSCPFCADTRVDKAVMAPAVPSKSNQRGNDARIDVAASAGLTPEKAAAMMQKLAEVQSEMLKGSEWVGDKFSEVARAMHYGEQDAKPIHGQAGTEEVRSLIDEGVEIAPLPLPFTPPEAKN